MRGLGERFSERSIINHWNNHQQGIKLFFLLYFICSKPMFRPRCKHSFKQLVCCAAVRRSPFCLYPLLVCSQVHITPDIRGKTNTAKKSLSLHWKSSFTGQPVLVQLQCLSTSGCLLVWVTL